MTVQLTSLVESSNPFLLAYSLPLLLLSIVIAFAGTFLTLDRTRTFAPREDRDIPISTSLPSAGPFNVEKKAKALFRKFRLDGGLGGVFVGYVFGLHAATFLSLLIMNESAASPLVPSTFLVLWIFSVIPTSILGGRWKIAALIFIGLSGGVTMSLALCIITHPTLLSRIIVTSIFTPLVTLAVIIPSFVPSPSLSNVAHLTSRVATSCMGAFSITMSISLLTRSQESYPWANVWDRLWVSDGEGWGTGREKGFDVLFCVLWICSALVDLGLNRWIGEDPDEKWDTYLADYVTSLPNANDRAGKYMPMPSWWDRLLRFLHLSDSNTSANPRDVLFPSDADLALKPQYISIPDSGDDDGDKKLKPAVYLSKEDLQRAVSPAAYNWEPPRPAKGTGFLRKERTRLGKGFGFAHHFKDEGRHASTDENETPDMLQLARKPTFLKKDKNTRAEQRQQRFKDKAGRTRKRLEFRPTNGFSSSDSDSDSDSSSKGVSSDLDKDELKTPPPTRTMRDVRIHSSTTSLTLSGTTIHAHPSGSGTSPSPRDSVIDEEELERNAFDVQKEEKALRDAAKQVFGKTQTFAGVPEYSDVEEDVTTAFVRSSSPPSPSPRIGGMMPGWRPAFIQRAKTSPAPLSSSPDPIEPSPITNPNPSPPTGAVPMTPSLIRAVERINLAQIQVYHGYGDPTRAQQQQQRLPDTGMVRSTPTNHQHVYPPGAAHVAIDMNPVRSQQTPTGTIPGLPVTDIHHGGERDAEVKRQVGKKKDSVAEEDWNELWQEIHAKAAS